MSSTNRLIASHLVLFSAGVVVGKSWNAAELNAYRASHETKMDKLRRRVLNVSIGLAGVAVVLMSIRGASARSQAIAT